MDDDDYDDGLTTQQLADWLPVFPLPQISMTVRAPPA